MRIRQAVADLARVPLAAIHVDITAASLLITITIDTNDQASGNALVATVSPLLGNAAKATAFLAHAGSAVSVDREPTVMYTTQNHYKQYQFSTQQSSGDQQGDSTDGGVSPIVIVLTLLVVGSVSAALARSVQVIKKMRHDRYLRQVDAQLGALGGSLQVVASPVQLSMSSCMQSATSSTFDAQAAPLSRYAPSHPL